MKLEDYQSQIEDYFANTSDEEIVQLFEDLGYEFDPETSTDRQTEELDIQ